MGSIIGTFTGKSCDSNVFNNNDMFLSRELFEKLLDSDEYKRGIANGHYIGFLGHPEDPGCQDFKDACIVMTACRLNDDGEVLADFNLIDTPVGRIVSAFIEAGVKFGISIRGAGDVDASGNVDPDTFVFRGFDLVAFPAYNDCIPEFQQIAASSDITKKVKYKKVCSTVSKNLASITSCEALGIIQDQFNDSSKEYAEIQTRIDELSNSEEDFDELALTKQKLDGMTDLYLEMVDKVHELEDCIVKIQCEANEKEMFCTTKLNSYKRIVSSQISHLEKENEVLSDSNNKLSRKIEAMTRIKAESERAITAAKQDNLKYQHKIEANSRIISEKDAAISELEKKLNETVVANTALKRESSNLDDAVTELEKQVESAEQSLKEAEREISASDKRIQAAEQMILSYQQAYANMYANALGVHLDNLSVTASTTVSELKDMICSSTSSANISPVVDFVDDIDEDVEDDYTNDEVADIVTL